ncbi:cilia- and flagella-associated protein 65, partial [Mantella aurantiaca]
MKQGGSSTADMKQGGSSTADMKQGGSSTADMKQGGSSTADMKQGGSSTADMKQGGSSTAALQASDLCSPAVMDLPVDLAVNPLDSQIVSNLVHIKMLGAVDMRPPDPGPFLPLNRNASIRRGSILQRNVSSEWQSHRKGKEKGKESALGFVVRRCLQWQNWEPGKEYTKHLHVKNVRLKTQRLKFSSPDSAFFTTIFPQMIRLSAGTSFSLPVTFRPLEERDYEDSITLETEEGIFSVSLQAVRPRHAITFPEELNLPMCAVYDSSQASFTLHSTSDLQTSFRWEVPEPFLLIPQSGELDPKCQIRTNVLFQPQSAHVHSAIATCHYGQNEEYTRSIQLTAIAKFPHLVIFVPGETREETIEVTSLLSFGSVGVGMVSEKSIEIRNPSVVNAPFRIELEKRSSHVGCDFSCHMTSGVVPARGRMSATLRFTPRTAGMESLEYFHVIPAGGLTKSVIKVSGTCKGPNAFLLTSVVNFGLVNLGEKILRLLQITNSSDVPASFLFDINNDESVFSFEPPNGTLSAGETRSVEVTFYPLHPIPHHRRVTCLLHHQDPESVDVIGTCHSETETPAIILPKHLSRYRSNASRGLTIYPPDLLDAMIEEKKLNTDAEGALILPQQIEGQCESRPLLDAASEFFNDEFSGEDSASLSHIAASARDFDFGRCVRRTEDTAPEPLPLSLTNHTKGKVTVIWTSKAHSSFRVTPEVTDIPPLKSAAFRVTFSPTQINTLYEAELEGFIFYKVLRDYRNVKDATICPPWCITLRARGHTFELGQEHFVPRYVLDSPRMVFPPVTPDLHSHCTLLLQNTGSVIMTYITDQKKCPDVRVKPSSGHLTPGSHHILLLRTNPHKAGLIRNILPIQLNYSADFTQEVVLYCRAEIPQLRLENEGRLYFKPTCVGAESVTSYSLKNCCRIPLCFQWKIPHDDLSHVSVTPCKGIIRPNETLSQIWTFVPQEERNYFIKAAVLSWPANEEPSATSRLPLRVTGDGCRGTLSTQRDLVDLGDILVGSFQSHDLLLSNDGDCTLEYRLSAKQEITGPCDPEEVINDPIALKFDQNKGNLPARTKLTVTISAHPARRLSYTWTISYSIKSPR